MHRLLLALALGVPLAAQTDLGRVLPEDAPLHVLAFGDFGSGNQHQTDIAQAMLRKHGQEHFNLGLTLGDNFYRCGVRGIHDSKWTTRWENLYTPLGIPFYATLGNHDYGHPVGICPFHRGSPAAEVSYTGHSKSWHMPAKYYTYAAGPARFFALDTEGWGEEQFAWLQKALEASANEPGIRWRIVYGHHPVLSSGHHANERRIGVLRRQLGPLFQTAKVDLYVCGHDHSLERLSWDGVDLLIAGGGGASLRFDTRPKAESKFASVKYGFLELSIDARKIAAQYYDVDLQPLDTNPLTRNIR